MTRNHRSAKDAGTRFNRSVADYLATVLEDDRIDARVKRGAKDRGDIAGLRAHGQRVVVECKDCSKVTLPLWVAEAHIEAANDDALVGVVAFKRRGVSDPARQWVAMTMADFVALLTGQKVPEP